MKNKNHIWVTTLFLSLFSASMAVAAIEVVTTTADLLAIVKAVGGERVKAVSIGKGNEDPHFIEPKPSYMMALGRARLLFLIGLDLEIWLKPLIEGSRNQSILPGGPGYADCSQVIAVKEIPQVRVDPSMGDVHPLGNPHYWLDPMNGVKIAEFMAQKLSEVDPAGREEFQANLSGFKQEIERSMPEWRGLFSPRKNRLVACFHSSWIYLTEAFGLEIVGYVEPKPGIPPTGRELASLIAIMKSKNAKVILREQYHSDRFANMAAEKAGARVLVLPASVGANDSIKTYPQLIDSVVRQIASMLEQAQ